MRKTSILIVDDHKLIRESWNVLLSASAEIGAVTECGGGEQAIALAREMKPDIVLMDINMEPMDGFEALRQIRKFSPSSKIIAVSMHSQAEYAKKMFRLGAKGYITKTSTRDEMLVAIKEVMAGGIFVCKEVKGALIEKLRSKDTPGTVTMNSLSRREMEIVQKLRTGHSSKEIGEILHISIKTVEVHRYNILKKLNLRNTISLINYINTNAIDS